jgi:hypothetical protein
LNTFPSGRDFDEHALALHTLRLVQGHDALGTYHGGGCVEAQTRIHFGGHAAGNGGQNLAAEAHQQTVDLRVHGLVAVSSHGVFEQGQVFGLLHRFENQRWVGGRVLRLKLGELFEVASVGHDGGELLEGVELVHRVIILCHQKSSGLALQCDLCNLSRLKKFWFSVAPALWAAMCVRASACNTTK